MKVAILSPYPTFPFAHGSWVAKKFLYGNNATWTVSLAQWLAKIPDTEVHVLTESDDIPRSKNIAVEGAVIHFIKVPARFKTLTFWQFDRLRLHRILDEIRPDIVHGQGIESQYGYAAVTAHYPCILTIHGLSKLSNRGAGYSPGSGRVRLVELFEWYCMRKVRNIIVINPFDCWRKRPRPIAAIQFVCDPQRNRGALTSMRRPNPVRIIFFWQSVTSIA